ncbi:MAG TPA: AAA family ATPase [Syntrophorhabdaceae bacterium]|jgi:type II secretory pathway predicted ATPase ExeA
MIEEYLQYWGLDRHPFLLAPDSRMMCVTGQYYECLERLKYAITTGKGGVLLVSEDAGLGKTTLLLKLIDDMKERYGDAFRYAYIDHPTLSAAQMISLITSQISGIPAGEDKLRNLDVLKSTLIDAKEQGGKSIIIVDEGQLLCEAHDVLQELRILINLTHMGEYLHTFILSGQRALWHTIKSMPEFWQRLPVRYYFVPLKLEETKELVNYRLYRAGAEEGREVFQEDALEIIHRYAKGSPRTLIALADLSLLVGYTNHAARISFKEVSKAIQAMSGQGESLPYVREEGPRETGPSLSSISTIERPVDRPPWKRPEYSEAMLKTSPPMTDKFKKVVRPGPAYLILAFVALFLAGMVTYFYISDSFARKRIANPAPAASQTPEKPLSGQNPVSPTVNGAGPAPDAPQVLSQPAPQVTAQPAPQITSQPASQIIPPKPLPQAPQKEAAEKITLSPAAGKNALVVAEAGNIRNAPDLDAPRIGVIFKDETIRIFDEKKDRNGERWFMVHIYGKKEGWISERVVEVREGLSPEQ